MNKPMAVYKLVLEYLGVYIYVSTYVPWAHTSAFSYRNINTYTFQIKTIVLILPTFIFFCVHLCYGRFRSV